MRKRSDRATDMPLFAWGAALRARRAARRRLIRRGAAIGAGVLAIVATIVMPPTPRLVWNASASAPIGLYAVSVGSAPRVGDTVIARIPVGYRSMAALRRYLPANVPLVKHVAAGPGDEICALGARIYINGLPAAERLSLDGNKRAMPWWRGCRQVRVGQVFLLMEASPISFDGRYFGLSDRTDIIGTARLVWAR